MSKGQATKEVIVAKAAALFNSKGYAGASVSDLMAATGLKKGGIYNHFSNKEEILLEAFGYAFDQVVQTLTAVIKSQYTATDKLRAIIDFYRDYPLDPVIEGGCPLINSTVEVDDSNLQLKAKVQEAAQLLINGFIKVIERGIRRGEFRADLDVEKTAILLLAQIEGGIVLTRATNDSHYINVVADQMLNYLEREMKV